MINQPHNIKFDESEEHFLINNYSWESIENVLKSYDNNVDIGWADLISQCDLLKLKEATSKYSKIGILAESNIGAIQGFGIKSQIIWWANLSEK